MTTSSQEITERLRSRILADLHAGRVDPRERLPSIRAVAEEIGADHRTVARAYRTLEDEGLVEIRPRSGVFIAPQDHLGSERSILAETAAWMAGVAAGAWTRRIPLGELPGVLASCVAGGPVRCLLVESVGDVRALWARELAEDFGLEVRTFAVPDEREDFPGALEAELGEALETTDFVVTSVYHARLVEVVGEERATPFAVVRYDARWLDERRRRLEEAPAVLVIALDPSGAARRAESLGLGDRLRYASAESWDGSAPEGAQVWCTPAAAERLGDDAPEVLGLPGPSLSADSARTVCELIVRTHLERGDEGCVV